MDKLPINQMNIESLANFKEEVKTELEEILNWWMTYAVDYENDGFYGKVDNDNIAQPSSPKGLVLNARILYTFSSAYLLRGKAEYLLTATSAYHYLSHHFKDTINEGFYWSVDEKGNMLDGKKQVYGQAFAIYGLTEYYKATQNNHALALARDTFKLLEKYCFDPINLGYVEALTQEWKPIEDLRLSDKDQNEKKSMNTHLHTIEAYANLYLVWQNNDLKLAIKRLLGNFKEHIIDHKTHHLKLFFTEIWEVKSSLISFGHDIEAAWLLQEAAEIINDEGEIKTFKQIALQMSTVTTAGLDKNGGLWYEYDASTNHWIKELHWWPQAEAMVGFFNAWQISDEEKYLTQALRSWSFIKNYLKHNKGEWHWGLNNDYSIMQGEDKAGFWKCPYHNGRACMEILRRMN
jgi:mannobiose 2-epimerase